jgi:hypothetical protein
MVVSQPAPSTIDAVHWTHAPGRTHVSPTLRPSGVACLPGSIRLFCPPRGGVKCDRAPRFAGAVASSRESIVVCGSGWLAFNGRASAKSVAVAFVVGDSRSSIASTTLSACVVHRRRRDQRGKPSGHRGGSSRLLSRPAPWRCPTRARLDRPSCACFVSDAVLSSVS